MRLSEEEYAALMRKRGTAVPSQAAQPSPKPRKFRNEPTMVRGELFDSKIEAARYTELLGLQDAGQISCLRHHVRYAITVNGVDICEYEVDFVYNDAQARQRFEDVKSKATRTALFRIKRLLMLAVHRINVEEVL